MFVLQVVVQTQPLGGQVLADHRHVEVGAALAPHFRRPGITIVAGLVGDLAGLGQQLLPLVTGQAVAIPVRAGVLAAMVEKPDVVVAVLDRLDLGLDEGVELGQIGGQLGG
ncbi:hypothetical protein GALL_537860 [mine drainage metagenome]|uniref:Uncharacterized protein n=1 Tax=mine drainage metagenome TaxID=410659 RepID=A0A1J5PA19_9ZZZZ